MAGTLRLSRNQFHIAGPVTEKARRPQLPSRYRGKTRRPWLAERRCCLEATRHWIQTGRGRRGTGVLGCADGWTPWGRAWTRPAPVHWAHVVRYVRVATSHSRTSVYCWPHRRRHSARVAACQTSLLERRPIQRCSVTYYFLQYNAINIVP